MALFDGFIADNPLYRYRQTSRVRHNGGANCKLNVGVYMNATVYLIKLILERCDVDCRLSACVWKIMGGRFGGLERPSA